MNELEKMKDGFVAAVKRLLRSASVEKGRIDKKYDDSVAALDAWKKEQEGRLEVAEQRLRNWDEAIDVPTSSPVDDMIARMESEKQKTLDLKAEIDVALAKP